jgi:hypothetical protein
LIFVWFENASKAAGLILVSRFLQEAQVIKNTRDMQMHTPGWWVPLDAPSIKIIILS